MKTTVKLNGKVNSRNRTYYSNLYSNAKDVTISDYCPNGKFVKPEACGYRKATKEDAQNGYKGMSLWHRRSTSMGAHKLFIAI